MKSLKGLLRDEIIEIYSTCLSLDAISKTIKMALNIKAAQSSPYSTQYKRVGKTLFNISVAKVIGWKGVGLQTR